MRTALQSFRAGLLVFALAALVLGAIAAWLLARWLARPLEAVGRHATELAAGRLEEPAPMLGPIEVRRLASAFDAAARTVRERVRGEQRARGELETILASLQEGVVAVDERERVMLMNRSAAVLLGLSAPLAPGGLWILGERGIPKIVMLDNGHGPSQAAEARRLFPEAYIEIVTTSHIR